jgi:hypothetical protein
MRAYSRASHGLEQRSFVRGRCLSGAKGLEPSALAL